MMMMMLLRQFPSLYSALYRLYFCIIFGSNPLVVLFYWGETWTLLADRGRKGGFFSEGFSEEHTTNQEHLPATIKWRKLERFGHVIRHLLKAVLQDAGSSSLILP